uniref:Uncharacterized protein n=1 Tax=Anopheles darlingi TaxID=43151 RepID=A0A2M4D5N7_ANODA
MRSISLLTERRPYGIPSFLFILFLAGFRSGVTIIVDDRLLFFFSYFFVVFHFKYSFLSNIYTFARTYMCVFAVPYYRLQKLFIVFFCLFVCKFSFSF